MNKKLMILGAALVLFAVSWSHALSANADDRFKGPDGSYANPAIAYGLAAPVAYFAVFGSWPQSWGDIRSAGLVQVDLRNSDGALVDMDDRSLDFPGDVHYIPASTSEPPKLALKSGTTVRIIALEPFSTTYDSLIKSEGESSRFYLLLGDRKSQALIGMQSMVYVSFQLFQVLEGRMPQSWEELQASGVAPFDSQSLNPLTNGALRFDGSDNQMRFLFIPDYQAPVVSAMATGGQVLWEGSVF